ncbi:hypothetical protein [Pseudomonas sp. NPDC089569]|uniref:hypothetical protein n=1 Tax=Pseudomonas sp. NPDC089569 TaxID=3390722 RepID=UPI003D0750A6
MSITVDSMKALVRRIPFIRSKKFVQTLIGMMTALWLVDKFRPHTGSLKDLWLSAMMDAVFWYGAMFLCLSYLVWDDGKKEKESGGDTDSNHNGNAE